MNHYVNVFIVLLLGVFSIGQAGKAVEAGPPMKALLLNGQSHHGWKASSPLVKQILEQTGLFSVDVATRPARGGDMESFKPDFAAYDLVVLDDGGEPWSEETNTAFVEYIASGGGVTLFHHSCQLFPQWKEFNEIMGLGGWGGRNEAAGPRLHWRDGKVAKDATPGSAGDCLDQRPYQIVIRDPEHPITKGLPEKWMHTKDELYFNLRGPAKNLNVLATAYVDPDVESHWGAAKHGSGEHEPALFTVRYGKGRCFNTTMGHVDGGSPAGYRPIAMECVGFIVTFQRGCEWAATGKVTQEVPKDFPTETEVRTWENCRDRGLPLGEDAKFN